MKPIQEQVWSARKTNTGPVVYDERGNAVCMAYIPLHEDSVTTLAAAEDIGKKRGAAIAALPDMARALLAFVRGMDGSEQGVDLENARLLADAALEKAGVLP